MFLFSKSFFSTKKLKKYIYITKPIKKGVSMKGQVAFSTKEKTLLEIRETAENILKTLDKLNKEINKLEEGYEKL